MAPTTLSESPNYDFQLLVDRREQRMFDLLQEILDPIPLGLLGTEDLVELGNHHSRSLREPTTRTAHALDSPTYLQVLEASEYGAACLLRCWERVHSFEFDLAGQIVESDFQFCRDLETEALEEALCTFQAQHFRPERWVFGH